MTVRRLTQCRLTLYCLNLCRLTLCCLALCCLNLCRLTISCLTRSRLTRMRFDPVSVNQFEKSLDLHLCLTRFVFKLTVFKLLFLKLKLKGVKNARDKVKKKRRGEGGLLPSPFWDYVVPTKYKELDLSLSTYLSYFDVYPRYFRDECTEILLPVFSYSRLSATVNSSLHSYPSYNYDTRILWSGLSWKKWIDFTESLEIRYIF